VTGLPNREHDSLGWDGTKSDVVRHRWRQKGGGGGTQRNARGRVGDEVVVRKKDAGRGVVRPWYDMRLSVGLLPLPVSSVVTPQAPYHGRTLKYQFGVLLKRLGIVVPLEPLLRAQRAIIDSRADLEGVLAVGGRAAVVRPR
jgi:hypothetical protein